MHDAHLHRGRQLGIELGHQRLDVIHHLNRIGIGLALDCQSDRAGTIEPARDLVVLDAVLDLRDIAEMLRIAVAIGSDERPILRRFGELASGLDHEVLLSAVDGAERGV